MKKIVPSAVHIEEAWRHQALVELLERQHAQYDLAIQHVAAIGPDRWGSGRSASQKKVPSA